MQITPDHVRLALQAIQRKEHKVQFSKDEHAALAFEGRQYPPKAVLNTALAIAGSSKLPRSFPRSKACKALADLGFDIVLRKKALAPRYALVDNADKAHVTDATPMTPAEGNIQSMQGTPPVESTASDGSILSQGDGAHRLLPDEVLGGSFVEGAVRTVVVNAYERDPDARRRCIEHHGDSCKICNINFGLLYPGIGEGYIHVHHLIPLSNIKKEYIIDPIADLLPVCPNCHAMLHSRRPHPWTPEEVRDIHERGQTKAEIPF